MSKKLLIAIGILVALAVAGLVCVTRIGITPTDTKIVEILYKKRAEFVEY